VVNLLAFMTTYHSGVSITNKASSGVKRHWESIRAKTNIINLNELNIPVMNEYSNIL